MDTMIQDDRLYMGILFGKKRKKNNNKWIGLRVLLEVNIK